MRLGISLRRRIVWLVIAATAPLFGLAFYKAVRDADTAVSRASSDLALAVSLVSTNQDRVVESAHQMLTSIVNAPGLMDMPAVACQRYFGDLNTQLPQYLNLGLVDLDGYFRCDGLTHRRVFAGNRYFFRAALERQRFVAGGYITGAVSGLPLVNFGLPMFAADGKAAAVAFVAINLTDLSRTLAGVQYPRAAGW